MKYSLPVYVPLETEKGFAPFSELISFSYLIELL